MSLITRLTYVLPHRALSSLVRRLAYSTHPKMSQWLIDKVTRKFGVNLAEAAESDPRAYASFNAFFTRALKRGVRVPDPDPRALLMPADGRISECGHIGRADEGVLQTDAGHVFQAKGHGFTTAELLGDESAAHAFDGGLYATVYLSPKDYHRVHMPWTGKLRETVHVPGRLFSVGPDAVGTVSRLFARNERLVCHFDTDFGPMALVMVGALLVSGVETVWGGVEIPPYGGPVTVKDYRGANITVERFAEMARFNYGSTVIVLLPKGVAELSPNLAAQSPVRLGERLARLS
jgi:phosphatidylserine decarboxylase